MGNPNNHSPFWAYRLCVKATFDCVLQSQSGFVCCASWREGYDLRVWTYHTHVSFWSIWYALYNICFIYAHIFNHHSYSLTYTSNATSIIFSSQGLPNEPIFRCPPFVVEEFWRGMSIALIRPLLVSQFCWKWSELTGRACISVLHLQFAWLYTRLKELLVHPWWFSPQQPPTRSFGPL